MNIELELKKEGIEVIEKIDTLKVNSLAKSISIKLCETFPEYNLNQNELFIKLCRLNMYKAKMPTSVSEASYFYKNTSVYINKDIDNNDIEEFIVHECIHYLQEIRDNKNNLLRMGFYNFNNKETGLGLNEASVQLIASKINGIPNEFVKYYGISFETISPSYYPLQCCLVNQLSYLVGEDILFKSTLFSNNTFEETLSNIVSPKIYNTISSSLTELLNLEQEIALLNSKILEYDNRDKKVDSMFKKIDELKNEISLTFFKTQNLIITSYFNNSFMKILNLEELENYRRKLYNFKKLLGTQEGYSYFDTYYTQKMNELEDKHILLENGYDLSKSSLYLSPIKNNIFSKILKAIKSILGIKKNKSNQAKYQSDTRL